MRTSIENRLSPITVVLLFGTIIVGGSFVRLYGQQNPPTPPKEISSIPLSAADSEKLSSGYVAYVNKKKELDSIIQAFLTTKVTAQNALEEKANAQLLNRDLSDLAQQYNANLAAIRKASNCLDCDPSPDFKQLNKKPKEK